MKYILPAITLTLAAMTAQTATAQTAIGSITPHPSAVVDIASANKGLLIPRIGTSLISGITAPADGLMIYDSVAKVVLYYKAGSGWRPVSRFTLTYTDTANSGSPAFNITNLGLGAGVRGVSTNAGAAYGVEGIISNASNANPLSAGVRGSNQGTAGSGVAGDAAAGIGVNGNSNTGTGVRGNSITGVGITANSSTNSALEAISNNGIGVYGYSNTSYGVSGYSVSNYGVSGQTVSGTAGAFANTGATNPYAALSANTAGISYALAVAATNASNSADALNVTHSGVGSGGFFNLLNTSNSNDGVYALTAGSGRAIHGKSATGMAGFFENTNAANTVPTVAITTNTTNTGLVVNQTGANGGAGLFSIGNSSSIIPVLYVSNAGTGVAGDYSTTNASANTPTVRATTAGTNNAVLGRIGSGTSGTSSNAAVWGDGGARTGLFGSSDNGYGVQGYSRTSNSGYFLGSATNASDVVEIGTQSSGYGLNAQTYGTGDAIHVGTGTIGSGISITATGSGNGVNVTTSGGGNALYATAYGTSTAYALTANTYAPQHAIAVFGSGAGSRGVYITVQNGQQAIAINKGRVAFATASITSGAIPTDATLVSVNNNTASSVPTVTLPTNNVEDGDIIVVAANDPDGVNVTGIISALTTNITYGESRQFIRIGGAWYREY